MRFEVVSIQIRFTVTQQKSRKSAFTPDAKQPKFDVIEYLLNSTQLRIYCVQLTYS